MPGKTHERVLLVGETVGTASVGLVYLASYLRRHGIDARCHWHSTARTQAALEGEIDTLLARVRPSLVGISLKWFPHIARALEIARLVKQRDPEIQVVMGGNTASMFYVPLIEEKHVDLIIRGDGERPLLEVCRGAGPVPNLVGKRRELRLAPEFGYRETEDTDDVYLSHLEEVFVDPDDLARSSSFFVYTGKRCNKKCFYCGGAATAMHQTFGSARPFFRRAELVRNDLEVVMRHAQKLLFDFDYEPRQKSQSAYFEEIFQVPGLERCEAYFYFWKLPQRGTLELLARTFGSVSVSVDLASLSEGQRRRLTAEPRLGVKPQPSDDEIVGLFQLAERLPNVTLDLSVIAGMPLASRDDVEESLAFVERLMAYRALGDVQWGWLHAQPGSPILDCAEQFGMCSPATTYEDFLAFSQSNLQQPEYPDWRNLRYPFLTYTDFGLVRTIADGYKHVARILEERGEARRARARARGAG